MSKGASDAEAIQNIWGRIDIGSKGRRFCPSTPLRSPTKLKNTNDSYSRELSKKAKRANNIWWLLSGMLGDQNGPIMYILIQAVFTVTTMALTVPIFLSYRMHVVFQIFKVSATVWYGASFLLDAMPEQVVSKEKKN